MAKWQVYEFESMWPPEELYVKTTFELVDKMKDVHHSV
jgi:hypothetical protein